jgi:hypothetical protein
MVSESWPIGIESLAEKKWERLGSLIQFMTVELPPSFQIPSYVFPCLVQ